MRTFGATRSTDPTVGVAGDASAATGSLRLIEGAGGFGRGGDVVVDDGCHEAEAVLDPTDEGLGGYLLSPWATARSRILGLTG